ncbi:dihydrofolate reductase family protein [Asticcacaulis sp. BYS171W]|uniref:Dihydrofolate reductase family protein n=1 Tax=Asticcacaulis aquaticus TaxID=2984212 RepID=A0ABT5HT31_9CAUL|nr:dihydrofolate reductase family protein [Asticcacaulis aquaticus]MDC7683000.1 dihydrofolate reductase family protein [Asticcacaulis aquaticus]
MAKFVLAMNVSIDGYVDDIGGNFVMPSPSETHFDVWTQAVEGYAGSLYGRKMYEVMRYWDEDRPEWDAARQRFAVAWRRLPKWVVSHTLQAAGPNATLISGDIEAQIRALKAQTDGTISVTGPQLAGLATQLGLIDEYHLHVRPFVLGGGKPFFHDARPPLRLVSTTQIDDDTVCLVYAPKP